MLNKKVESLLNDQVNKEFYSAYLYLDMSNFYKDQGLDGFSNWYMIQTQEERDHALLFIKYLQLNGKSVALKAIDKPDQTFSKIDDPLKIGAEHERYVTELIHNIYDEAQAAKDFRTTQFLDWFVKEQAEEEETADNLIQKYKLFGNDPKGLYSLDAEFAGRAYTPPSLVL